jgi:8-oxo-dGTP pyrophosphatase MutT (NUDIX family)
VLLIDDADRLLLLRMRTDDPARFGDHDHVWLTPGGGVEPGETHEQAALRELFEETRIDDQPLGALAFVRDREVDGVKTHDRFYVVRVPSGTPIDSTGTTAHEQLNGLGHRWFSADEIQAREAEEMFLPIGLGGLAAEVVSAGGSPPEPIRIHG